MKNNGYIYVISNKAWSNHYKIGITKDVEDRLANYQTYSPFKDFKVEYSVYTENYLNIESEICKLYNTSSEWIKDDKNNIIKKIESSKYFKKIKTPKTKKYIKLLHKIQNIKENYIDKYNIKLVNEKTIKTKCGKLLQDEYIKSGHIILKLLNINVKYEKNKT